MFNYIWFGGWWRVQRDFVLAQCIYSAGIEVSTCKPNSTWNFCLWWFERVYLKIQFLLHQIFTIFGVITLYTILNQKYIFLLMALWLFHWLWHDVRTMLLSFFLKYILIFSKWTCFIYFFSFYKISSLSKIMNYCF